MVPKTVTRQVYHGGSGCGNGNCGSCAPACCTSCN